MFACEISLILLCFFYTIYALLLLMVGRVVVHLCDHNYSYGRIGGLRQASAKAAARALAATKQVHEADIERKKEIENARRGDDDEEDDTDEDQVSL